MSMEERDGNCHKMSQVVVKCLVTFFFPSPSRRPLLVFAEYQKFLGTTQKIGVVPNCGNEVEFAMRVCGMFQARSREQNAQVSGKQGCLITSALTGQSHCWGPTWTNKSFSGVWDYFILPRRGGDQFQPQSSDFHNSYANHAGATS